MKVLGLSGGILTPDLLRTASLPSWFFHDSGAAVVEDGVVLAAIEEERLDRNKHSRSFPRNAVRECLQIADVAADELDAIGYYSEDWFCDWVVYKQYPESGLRSLPSTRESLVRGLAEALDVTAESLPAIRWVKHHAAHAWTVVPDAGFERSIVLVMDGAGETVATTGYLYDCGELRTLTSVDSDNSLGQYYTTGTELLGYREFDEYKVMGLAPLGDPARFRQVLRPTYELLPSGSFTVDARRLRQAMYDVRFPIRGRDEVFTDEQRDFAAALQEVLETVGIHHAAYLTGSFPGEPLCLSGGVAQNCTLNARLLNSGMFRDVFVHPAAHDGGTAVGVAQALMPRTGSTTTRRRDVFWGKPLPADDQLPAILDRWSELLVYERPDSIADRTADALAEGLIVGWVQGRSEYGPRALGHRSILADARIPDMKDRVNYAVKGREGYRPFAPSSKAESFAEYFEYPPDHDPGDYMVFTYRVAPRWRSSIPSVVHADGTARAHCVRRESNPVFWTLLDAFERRTGCPMLLNTSFNNSHEPIVDSPADAVQCFLTTNLDGLAIGGYWVVKRPDPDLLRVVFGQAPGAVLEDWHDVRTIRVGDLAPVRMTPLAADLIRWADGRCAVGEFPRADLLADEDWACLRRAWVVRAIRCLSAEEHA